MYAHVPVRRALAAVTGHLNHWPGHKSLRFNKSNQEKLGTVPALPPKNLGPRIELSSISNIGTPHFHIRTIALEICEIIPKKIPGKLLAMNVIAFRIGPVEARPG